jgi:hypothetical protein
LNELPETRAIRLAENSMDSMLIGAGQDQVRITQSITLFVESFEEVSRGFGSQLKYQKVWR